MIVAILGTLKAGAAYLPLDPDYPAERRVFMLEDAGAKRILTTLGDLEGFYRSNAVPEEDLDRADLGVLP